MRASSRLLQPRATALVPSTWSTAPAGWHLYPDTHTPEDTELSVSKSFDFMNHGAQYLFLGEVMALAEELDCIPRLAWFFSELRFTLPPTPSSEVQANYMNDLESQRCGLRNHSPGGVGSSTFVWSRALTDRVAHRAEHEFCWLLTKDQRRTQQFLQETFLQWHHRADYLVTRQCREKREFRQDLTLHQVIQQGQERKRRMQRRRSREEERADDIKHGRASHWDNFTHDVLPRELRDALDRESDGMEDVRLSRMGTATGGWSRSHRRQSGIRG